MTDEGYLIGYEDAQGNFVQIGQFNNAADDVTQPLVLRHTNSGETLELDGSSFRPSTQIGEPTNRPDVFANTVDLNSLVGAGLDTKADLTQSGGVLVASQLPDLAITNIDVVADQSSRLALNAEEGDVAIQTDISETFILSTNDPTVDSNWKKVQLDVLGAIDGQQITPSQTGTSTNPTTVESDTVTATNIEAGQIGDSSNRPDVFADTVDANQLTGVSTGGIKTKTRVFLGSNSSADPIPFNRFSYDPDNNFDTATNEYIVPATGSYQIALNVRLASSVSAGTRADFLVKRNSSFIDSVETNGTGSQPTTSVTDIRELTSGDSITIENFRGRSVASGQRNTFLTIIRLE